MNDSDIKGLLLMGEDVSIHGITIKNYKLKEIIKYGMVKHNRLIGLITLKPSDMVSGVDGLDSITMYELICEVEQVRVWFVRLMFYLTDITFQYNDIFKEFFVITDDEDKIVIGEKECDEIFDLIKKMYCLSESKKDEFKPVNDEVAQAFAEFEEWEEELAKNDKNKITLGSIIAGLNSNKNCKYNFFDIFNLTIYQLMSTYYGVEQNSNYYNIINGVYSGTISSKDVKDIHWAKEIEI